MDWLEFYELLQTEFADLMNAPEAQFGTESQPYLLATLLPERVRTDVIGLTFEDSAIAFRSAPALDNTRYSPVQFGQSGMESVDINVSMGHTDTASQLTARDHDGIMKYLQRSLTQQAAATAVQWADRMLLQPHLDKNEIQRAQALLIGAVTREGTNGFSETVDLAVPVGYRPEIPGGTVAAPAGWFDPDYPILDDLLAGQAMLAMNGFRVTNIITDSEVLTLMKRNSQFAQLNAAAGTDPSIVVNSISNAALNNVLSDYELPGITRYDNGYRYPLANGGGRYRKFMQPTDTHLYVLIAGNTGRSEEVAGTGNENPILTLENTLGYYAIGLNPGQSVWGRTVHTEILQRKPRGLYGESYQTGFPVISNADAVYVLRLRRPTP